MPRTADHDARRRQVAEAVQRLIDERGLDGVTVARTAEEAGISVGLVQHYFATKDEMLLFTFARVVEGIFERVYEVVASAESRRMPIRRTMCDGLAELVPLDDVRRREYRVTLAFRGRTVDNPRLAEVQRRTAAEIRAEAARAIENGKECGEVPEDTGAGEQAIRLTAFVDGLALLAYTDPVAAPREVILAALEDFLATIFTGPCRQWEASPG